MPQLMKKLSTPLVHSNRPPTSARLEVFQGTAMSSEDQREKLIKLLMTAEMLAVDLGDRALVTSIRKAIADARQGFVRQA